MAYLKGSPAEVRPLYTAPQQRPWEGLTDEDKDEIIRVTMHDDFCDILMLVEAKLKEKNA
jgi:hypothetical protein